MIVLAMVVSVAIGGCPTDSARTTSTAAHVLFVGRPLHRLVRNAELVQVQQSPSGAALERSGIRAGVRVVVVWHDAASCTIARDRDEPAPFRVDGTLRARANWVNHTPTVDAVLPARDHESIATAVSGFYRLEVRTAGTATAGLFLRVDPRVDSLDWRAAGTTPIAAPRAWLTAWVGPTLESLSPCLAHARGRTAALAIAWPRDIGGGQARVASLDSVAVVLTAAGYTADPPTTHQDAVLTVARAANGRWTLETANALDVLLRAEKLAPGTGHHTDDFGVCPVPIP
jgi:hypothetical protein